MTPMFDFEAYENADEMAAEADAYVESFDHSARKYDSMVITVQVALDPEVSLAVIPNYVAAISASQEYDPAYTVMDSTLSLVSWGDDGEYVVEVHGIVGQPSIGPVQFMESFNLGPVFTPIEDLYIDDVPSLEAFFVEGDVMDAVTTRDIYLDSMERNPNGMDDWPEYLTEPPA